MADETLTNLGATVVKPEVVETPKPPETKVYTEAEVKVILAEKEKVEKQLSGLHKELSKRDLKLKEAQELRQVIEELDLGQAALRDEVKKLKASGNYPEVEEEEPPQPKGETHEQAKRRIQAEREAQRLANQFIEEATEAGLTEAEKKEIMYSTRSYEEARLKLSQKLTEKEKTKVATGEAELEKKYQERLEAEKRKWLAETGQLKVETRGTPGGGGVITKEELARRQNEPGFFEWFKEHEKDITDAHKKWARGEK